MAKGWEWLSRAADIAGVVPIVIAVLIGLYGVATGLSGPILVVAVLVAIAVSWYLYDKTQATPGLAHHAKKIALGVFGMLIVLIVVAVLARRNISTERPVAQSNVGPSPTAAPQPSAAPTPTQNPAAHSTQPPMSPQARATPGPPSITFGAPVTGSIITQGQNGGQNNVTNNYGPADWRLSRDQSYLLTQQFKTLEQRGKHSILQGFTVPMGDVEAAQFAQDLLRVFQDAGWDLRGRDGPDVVVRTGGVLRGIRVNVRNEQDANSDPVLLTLNRTLMEWGFPVYGNIAPGVEPGHVFLDVGSRPEGEWRPKK